MFLPVSTYMPLFTYFCLSYTHNRYPTCSLRMIPQTYIAAFITACLVAGSQAGPCKPSSRITSFTTSDVSTTVGSTTAFSSAETTTVAVSSTSFSNEESSVIVTESVSSTETSLGSEETSTTALSTTEGTTAEIATTTEAATATATTTTSEAPSAIPFISNAGFEDDSSSTAPWELTYGENTVSVVSDVKHDGRNSARITQGQSMISDYIRQPLRGSITAGVTYTMSAWVNANYFCPGVTFMCSYQDNYWTNPEVVDLTAATDEWTYISSTCTYTQEQIDSGGLYFMIGFNCIGAQGQGYIDTVDFSA
ncbi:hypothetical protein DER46DRAFT_600982 [Fusarium sp. MPI-SDFR-AT-0072]|nr:hypothetical protein DER46DRAFT_600982 [Fusarium sp. MPI-SDFR-AT-0072]